MTGRRLFLMILASSCAAFVSGYILRGDVTTSPVTREIVTAAEKLLGLSFTDAKRDSMLDGLTDQLKNYQSIRAVALPNSTPPAILFNPVPVGMHIPKTPSSFTISDPGSVLRPA